MTESRTRLEADARDAAHRRHGFPDGIVTHYRWDGRGLLLSVADPVAGTWQFAHDAAGRVVQRRYPGDVRWEMTYTPEGFVSEVQVYQAGSRFDWLKYQGHDARGNPATLCQQATVGTCNTKTVVAYDALSRITSLTYPGSQGSESFSYDLTGTRIGHVPRTGPAREYTYDPTGTELDEIVDAATQAVLESFDYDAVGRRTKRTAGGQTTSYGYDALGRLRSFDEAATSFTLGYDPLGHRRERVQGSELTQYLGEWLRQRSTAVPGEFQRFRLVHAPGVDQVMAEVEKPAQGADVPRYLLPDGIGNVTHIATASVIQATRRYEAFGTLRDATGSVPVERGFAGRPTEGASNLINLRARHYDPATGQFLQPDPLGIATDHLYAYAANNPVVFSDPFGLDPQETQATGVWSIAAEAVQSTAAAASYVALGGAKGIGQAVLDELSRDVVVQGLAAFDQAYGDQLDAITFTVSSYNPYFGLPSSNLRAISSGASLLAGRVTRAAAALDAAVVGGSRAGRVTTDFLVATVRSRGKILYEGTVDLRATVEGIRSGRVSPRNVFRNDEKLLPLRPINYYDEFVHPTPGFSPGPQRVVRGRGGELYYSPDHYQTFVPLN